MPIFTPQANPGPSVQSNTNLGGGAAVAWANSAGTAVIGPTGAIQPFMGAVTFSNSNGINFGVSTSAGASGTVTAALVPLTRFIWPYPNLTAVVAPTNASFSLQYVANDWPVTATRVDALVAMSGGSTASAVTAALAFSQYCAIYTRSGSTLSSLSSGSTQTTYSYASNSAGHTELTNSQIYPFSVPMNVYMTPGEYYVGFNIITNTSSIGAATTANGLTLSMMGGNQLQTALNYGEFANTATSSGLLPGMGVYSAASTGLPVSVAISGIQATGANQAAANIGLVFRNA